LIKEVQGRQPGSDVSRRLDEVLKQDVIYQDNLEQLFSDEDFFQLEEREKSIGEIFSGIDIDGNGAISK
jgi:hypothetical protein